MSKIIDMFGAITFPAACDLIEEFMAQLPTNPPDKGLEEDCPIWVKGDTIMCRSEWLAETICNIIERLCGDATPIGHTGYYDPEEDERNNEVDEMTGWYYVDFD